jgi:spore maturation protein CgeB
MTGVKNISYEQLSLAPFKKNMMALMDVNPDLVHRIDAARIHNKISLFQNGDGFINGSYAINRHPESFYKRDREKENERYYGEYCELDESVLFLGIGLGYGLDYLLRHSPIPRIYVYERDKSLLKVAFTLNDFAAQILTGRLVVVPQEALGHLADRSIRHIVSHPIMFSENKVDYLTLSRVISGGQTAARRAVIFSGQLFVLDFATTLFDLGWDILEVDVTVLNAEEANAVLDALHPDLIVNINLFRDITEFCKGCKVVEWEIDPTISPIEFIDRGAASRLFVYTHNQERLPFYESKGYKNVAYLPLCTNEKKFSPGRVTPDSLEPFRCDISFVGSLMRANQERLMQTVLSRLNELSSQECETWSLVKNWIRRLMEYPPEPSRSLDLVDELKSLLQTHCLTDIVMVGEDKLLISACVTEFLAYRWRRHVLTALSPFGVQIWGDPDWRADFPDNYMGIADHYLDLPKIYMASKINLDVCRICQPEIITMRVFDVLACGGFVLADRNDALLEFFHEDIDLACYQSVEEAIDKMRFYLAHEEERRAIAARGQQKVLNAHTFRHRVRQLLQMTGVDDESDHFPAAPASL